MNHLDTSTWPKLNRKAAVVLVASILTFHTAMLISGALRHSPTYDEPQHLAAGLRILETGRFDLDPGNPPLVKVWAATPVIAARWLGTHLGWEDQIGTRPVAAEVSACQRFWPFAVGRLACCGFALIGALTCFAWAAELYGTAGGLCALALWCFCPNVLGHAPLVTGDIAATSLGLAASYTYWRWLRFPSLERTLAAGLVLGLAELTKYVMVILYVGFVLEWLLWRFLRQGDERAIAAAPKLLQMCAIFLVSFYIINMGYFFKGSFRRLDSFAFTSRAFARYGETLGNAVGGNGGLTRKVLGGIPSPLPARYLMGLDAIQECGEQGFPSYLRGRWSEHGRWYYFVYGLAIKVPVGTLLLIALAAALTTGRAAYPRGWRDELCLLLPSVLILSLVSTQTRLNQHVRYALPCLPFLFVWSGKVARSLDLGHTRVACMAATALAWTVISSVSVLPHHISYFNELAGGPRHGHQHLLDSNIDWGQDLFFLKDYLKAEGIRTPIGLVYFGPGDPKAFDVQFQLPPPGPSGDFSPKPSHPDEVGPCPGTYAVSVNFLCGMNMDVPNGSGGRRWIRGQEYEYFHEFRPSARVGYSIFLFRISRDEANRVRRRLGLPPFDGTIAQPGESGSSRRDDSIAGDR